MPLSPVEQAQLACADETTLRRALDEASPHIRGGWSFLADLPDTLQRRIRDELVQVLKQIGSGHRQVAHVSDALLNRMMHVSVGQVVPSEYNAVFREEAGFDERDYRSVP